MQHNSEGSHKQNYDCQVHTKESGTPHWSLIFWFMTPFCHLQWHLKSSKIIALCNVILLLAEIRKLTHAKLWLRSSHWRVGNTILVTHILMTPFCHLQWHLKSSKIIALCNVILLLAEIRKLTHAKLWLQSLHWRVRTTTLVTHILMTPFRHLQWHLTSSRMTAIMQPDPLTSKISEGFTQARGFPSQIIKNQTSLGYL